MQSSTQESQLSLNTLFKPVYLWGLPGVGKTTLGKRIASHYNLPFIDLDKAIEKSIGLSPSELIVSQGEPFFRKIETAVLKQISDTPSIIATGGGAPCFNKNALYMNKKGITIWLNVPLYQLEKQLSKSAKSRPLLQTINPLKETLYKLFEQRVIYYKSAQYEIERPSLEKLIALFEKKIVV